MTTKRTTTIPSKAGASDFTIRPATLDDLPRIAELDCELYPVEVGWSLEDFEEDFSTEGRYYIVAVAGRDIIGYAACAVNDGIGELTVNTVIPAWRGRGIGRLLLEARLDWLDQRVDEIYLQTRVDNDVVLRTYSDYGFDRTDEPLTDYYGPGRHAVEMYRHSDH